MQSRSFDIDDILKIAGAALAVLALILGAVGFVRREDYRPVVAGLSLGADALFFSS